ncbi:MAG: DUF1256 domain-containing protein [Bacilli bacterium]|nr:DUF1256 domain-containing protein [Bacilli bacterium]MBP3635406.1 DUF1256 domain-containing protein [Bacilli bacterium]
MKKQKIYEYNNINYIEARNSLASYLKKEIAKLIKRKDYDKIMIVCIGTSKVIFDSYGPIVGSILSRALFPFDVRVYGTIEKPINGLNIESFILKNASEFNKNLVIAVDSMFSKYETNKSIYVSNRGLKPGSALGKSFPTIGEFSIGGIVSNYSDPIVDNIDDILDMCNITCDALFMALKSDIMYEQVDTECYKRVVENNKRLYLGNSKYKA